MIERTMTVVRVTGDTVDVSTPLERSFVIGMTTVDMQDAQGDRLSIEWFGEQPQIGETFTVTVR